MSRAEPCTHKCFPSNVKSESETLVWSSPATKENKCDRGKEDERESLKKGVIKRKNVKDEKTTREKRRNDS